MMRMTLIRARRPVTAGLLLALASLMAGAGTAVAQTAADGDIEAGKLKAYTCTGCHGIPGYNNTYPTYHVPRLGGQHADYIVIALKAYRDGLRDHSTMTAQAASLSDQDIADIAAYFGSLGKGE